MSAFGGPDDHGMQRVHQALRRTAARLRSLRLLRHAVEHLALASAAALLLVLVDKSGLLPWADWSGTGILRGGAWTAPGAAVPSVWRSALLGATLLALGGAWFRARLLRITDEQAALALEARTGTKERLASAAALDERHLLFAAPLAEDAARIAESVRVNRVFPLHAGRAGRRFAGALLALLLVLFVLPELDLRGARARQRAAAEAEAEDRAEVEALARRLRQQARQIRGAQAEVRTEEERRELAELTARMESLARTMMRDRTVDPREAKRLMNRLREELRDEAGRTVKPARRVADAATPDRGAPPLQETARALGDGSPAGAARALGRLERTLRELGTMAPEELGRLAAAAKALAASLDEGESAELAERFEQIARALERMERAGGGRTLEKLAREHPELAGAMKALAEGRELPPGGLDHSRLSPADRELLNEIVQAMAEMRRGMEGAQGRLAEMPPGAPQARTREITTEDLLAMLEAIEEGRLCMDCQGGGCSLCGGTGLRAGLSGGGGGGTGWGLGHSPGGVVPEPIEDAEFTDTRIRTRRIGPGRIVGQWFVRGVPPTEADARAEYFDAVEAATGAPEVVRERESIPIEDRALVRDYQNAIRGLD